MKRRIWLLSVCSLLVLSLAYSQATPPQGFVRLPDTVSCSLHNVMQEGGASTGGAWVLSSVGSLTCKSALGKSSLNVPLVDGSVNNGILATKLFGDLYIGDGSLSSQPYIRAEQVQPFVQFLDAAPPPPAYRLADGSIVKPGDVFPVKNKKDLRFLENAEGARLSNTRLPSGTLVPAAPDGLIWRVRNGKVVLEQNP